MRSLAVLAFLALSVLPTQLFAANTPPEFDAARWQKLWQLTAFIGEKMEVGDGRELRFFKNIVPENKQEPHRADYLSVIGLIDSFGQFQPMEVSVVSEDWRKRPNNDWEIEQWIFQLRMNGELKWLSHSLLIEDPNGHVLDIQTLPSGEPDSPEMLERWGAKLQEWYNLYP